MKILRQIILVHRHGDRCPGIIGSSQSSEMNGWLQTLGDTQLAHKYPIRSSHSDPPKHYHPPIGRLTQRGGDQLTKLGRQLRKSYPTLTTSPTVFASNYYRTQQSAAFLLDGLNAKKGTEIHVRPFDECVIDPFSRYTQIHKLTTEMARSALFRKHEQQHGLDPIRQKLEQMPCFAEPDNAFQWFSAVDVLTCHRYHPDLLKPQSIQELLPYTKMSEDYLFWRFKQYYSSSEVMKLACGDLLSEILSTMSSSTITATATTTTASPTPSSTTIPLTVYSGHDVTVMPLASIFGHQWSAWPDYASHMVLEIWGNNENDTSVVAKLNSELNQPTLDTMCELSLDELKVIVDHMYA